MPIRPENRDRYPANWPEISAHIRFVRAEGRCECLGECGRGTHAGRCPNVNRLPAYGTGSTVVLTVAHLDHTPENCHEANLRAMCQGCHLHYDREHHRQTAAATRRARLEAAGQLTLKLPTPRAPEPVLYGVVVDEVLLNSLGTPAGPWWLEQSMRFDRTGKLRYLAAVPVGAVVELGPYPKDDAEFMRDHMIEKGVHQKALKLRRWTEQPHMPKCREAAPCRLCVKPAEVSAP